MSLLLADPDLAELTEWRLCRSAVVLVAVTAVLAHTAGAWVGLGVLATVLVGTVRRQSRRHAALLAITAWCLLTGFVVNDAALLTLGAVDLGRLGALVGLALVSADRARGRRRAAPTLVTRRSPSHEPVATAS